MSPCRRVQSLSNFSDCDCDGCRQANLVGSPPVAEQAHAAPSRHVTIPPACMSSSVHILIAPRPGEQVVIEPGAPCRHHTELAEATAILVELLEADEDEIFDTDLWDRVTKFLASQP